MSWLDAPHKMLTCEFGVSINVYRHRGVFFRVRRPLQPLEYIIRADVDKADTKRIGDLGHIPRSQSIHRKSLRGLGFTSVHVLKCSSADDYVRPDALKCLPHRIKR